MTDSDHRQITLKITGGRAKRGVSLSDFELFIDNFLRALRDYDRSGRGEPTKPMGHPDRRAEAVSAFRLIGFQIGSGVAFIEPEIIESDDQLPVIVEPLSLRTLRSMADDFESGRKVPAAVIESLAKACGSAGPDGAVSIGLPGQNKPVVVDRAALDRASKNTDEVQAETQRISGRLHLIDTEPGRVGIRTAGGVEWASKYAPELESRVFGLIGMVVWAEGTGTLSSPLRGSLALEHIEPLESEQGTLFTAAQVDDVELGARQGIEAPQGLGLLTDPDWDDATDDAYLAALLGG